MASHVTYAYIRQNPDIREYIRRADMSLAAIGYTEHSFAHVEKVAATESKEGVKEHYRCTECGDLFLDENGTTPATEDNLKIAKLQKKGCKGSVGGLGLALAAFGAAFVALKKKR